MYIGQNILIFKYLLSVHDARLSDGYVIPACRYKRTPPQKNGHKRRHVVQKLCLNTALRSMSLVRS